MTLATVARVSYAYPRAASPALDDVAVEITPGEFVLVAGPSGGGKSTFLRLFNGLVPQFHGGAISGRVTVDGLDAMRTPARQMALAAGMVFQEPEAQSIAETVLDEVVFGLEQRAIPVPEMRQRVDRVLDELGVGHLRHRRLATLSGGERQRVAATAVLALEPKLLLLDEPTSQLDGAGADALITALLDLRRRRDLAIIASEHRLDRLIPRVDRVLELDRGRLRAMTPVEALGSLEAVPPAAALLRRLGVLPTLCLDEARRFLPLGLTVFPGPAQAPGDLLIEATGLSVAYGEQVALRDAAFTLREGELVALIGQNGSGKTTLLRALTGLSRPFAGSVRFARATEQPRSTRAISALAGLVPQDPAIALYHETVREEVEETLHNHGRSGDAEVAAALAAWDVAEFARRNPRDLSVGQQQRVAVAAMLAHRPRVWLLDEPTRGADRAAKHALAERLRSHAENGGAAIVATHDIESAATFATRVIALDAGEMVADLPARAAFSPGGPCPTEVARLVPGAITEDEVRFDHA